MKFKCILKHFWHGFRNGLVFSYVEPIRTCPHCCEEISLNEYHDKYTFTLGCPNCRDEHIYTDLVESGYSHEILDHMNSRLKELE